MFGNGHRGVPARAPARQLARRRQDFPAAYPDPHYVRLTGQAQRLWRQLGDEAGEELVLTTGALDYGPAREQEKMYDVLTSLGVPAELLAAAAERRPGRSRPGRGRLSFTMTRSSATACRPGGTARSRVRSRSANRKRHGHHRRSPGRGFILDRQGPFVVCSPCSGRGAKFAPLVGQIAADLACGRAAPDPRFTLAAHG